MLLDKYIDTQQRQSGSKSGGRGIRSQKFPIYLKIFWIFKKFWFSTPKSLKN